MGCGQNPINDPLGFSWVENFWMKSGKMDRDNYTSDKGRRLPK
jgi:hypothetical protein